ncbi:F-box domain protein [Paraphaeosphaeria sporulosa]
MAAFLNCPTELVDSILEQVLFRDLAALSLASKKLHEFATPQLYSDIDLSIHQGNPRPIINLTRSIFNNPELAKHVKSVRLRDGDEKIQKLYRGYSYDESVPKVSPPRPTDEDGMPEFIEFIKNTGLSYAHLWIDKLRIADFNAFVALLLSRLPALKSFRVGYAAVVPYIERSGQRNPPNIAGENQFLGKLFQSAVFNTSNHGLSRFQHLEEISFPGPISVNPGKNPDFCNPCDMVALLSLPSIRSIRGWCWNPPSFPFTWPTAPPDPVHLTSLALSYVHVDFLAQILATTRALKTLYWKWKWIRDTHPLNTDTIDLNRFVEAVQPIRDALEDLTIGFEFDDMSWGGIEPGMMKALGTLHGLEGFANIKRFQAPLGILLPDWNWNVGIDPARRLEDSLPCNVEVVTVTDAFMSDYYAYDEYEELDFVRAWLLETASTRTPRLKEVCYYLDRNASEFEEKSCEPIKQIFEGTNVRYRIIKARDEKPWEAV